MIVAHRLLVASRWTILSIWYFSFYLLTFSYLPLFYYLAMTACITTTLPADRRSSLFSIPLVYINVTPESQTSSLFSRDYHQNPLRVHALRLHDWRLR